MWLFHLHSAVKNRAFFPVFPLAGSTAEAFFRLFLWSFKEKHQPFSITQPFVMGFRLPGRGEAPKAARLRAASSFRLLGARGG